MLSAVVRDLISENSESDTWFGFARDCGYLKDEEHKRLSDKCIEVGRMLGAVLKNSQKFLFKR